MTSFPPQFYLLGAQKAGSTTLAHLLGQHPNVCLSDPKEPHYFSYHWPKGLKWYRKRFPRPDTPHLLDASVSYTMAPLTTQGYTDPRAKQRVGIPDRLHKARPDARFLFILREPVARAYSAYWHNKRTNREKRSFVDAARENPLYRDASDYAGQLELWLRVFPRERFHFLRFEDLTKDPVGEARKAFAWMGIDASGVEIDASEPQNESTDPGVAGRVLYGWVAETTSAVPALGRLVGGIRRRLPRRVSNSVTGMIRGTKRIERLSREDADAARPYLMPDMVRLREMTGISYEEIQ